MVHRWKRNLREYLQLYSRSRQAQDICISDNVLGFANASGTGFTIIVPNGFLGNNYASMIQAIIFNPSTGTASTISNNTIAGFDLTSSRSRNFRRRKHFLWYIHNGATSSRVVVSEIRLVAHLLPGRLLFALPPLQSLVLLFQPAAIYMRQNSASTHSISGNSIGGISMIFSSPGVALMDKTAFYGIYFDNAGQTTVDNHTD